jgi:hypothetical protein
MKTRKQLVPLGLATTVFVAMLDPSAGQAMPNFSRKYRLDCITCHDPAAPRLNAFGHQFRKMGYRMDTETGKEGKPEAYKELGDYVAIRFRVGYGAEHFSDRQKGGANFNSFQNRNGFLTPDYVTRPNLSLFYAGSLTKNLSMYSQIGIFDSDRTVVQAFGQWFSGAADRYFTARLGQMHTLSRVGFGGFDRPTGITTPDLLASKLTTTPVPFRVEQDQRGMDVAYSFTADSRLIAGIYNGIAQNGSSNEGAGAGFGDSDNAKDVLVAFEQMFGDSGFTLFGYYGTWDQKAGTAYDSRGNVTTGAPFLTTVDDKDQTEFNFIRLGATASVVLELLDPKKVGRTELQGGYMYAKDFYPTDLPFKDRDGYALWAGVEQRLPHASAVFYRFDWVQRSHEASGGARLRHTLGAVYTLQQYLRLAAEGFIYDQDSDSFGILLQAMFAY